MAGRFDQETALEEVWRLSLRFGVEASSLGRVRNFDRTVISSDGARRSFKGQVLKGWDYEGYRAVTLPDRRDVGVHRIVADAFLGPRPLGQEVCHKDGTRDNNALSNLEYGTRQKNVLDSVAHGTHVQARKTHCKRGHEFTPENTVVKAKGRECKECQPIHWKAYRDRKRLQTRSSEPV